MATPNVDEIWADYNPDGTVHEPNKADVRRWGRYIEAIATAAGMETYPNKAAMDADLTQEDGQPALLWADPTPANNFPTVWVYNDATNTWIAGIDRIQSLKDVIDLQALQIAGASSAADGIYTATGAPRPVAFADTSSYAKTWGTISNPSTRFTITPSAAGFQVQGLPAMATPWPVGIKLPWDLIPGDSYYFEGSYSAGSSFIQLGFFFGTDPATTGDISSGARFVTYRDTILVPTLANAISADGARAVSPAWAATGAVTTGMVFGFAIDVLSDRSLRWRVYRDGVQQLVDVVVAPATAAGAVVVGLSVINGVTGRVSKILRKTSAGKTIWIDSAISVSGNGSRNSPLKSMLDVPAYLSRIGYQDEVTINWLSDDDYGYLQCKDTVAGKWNLNGRPGGQTKLNGYIRETVSWTAVSGTSNTVWSTPHKWGNEGRSQLNQAFVVGVNNNPRPWYTFPDLILPVVTTANGGVDMAGLTGGAQAQANGLVYIRLPNGVGPDPATATIRLSRTATVVEVVGGPEVNLSNLSLQYSAQHLFIGGAGRGVIRNCSAHWSGYIGNGFECQNGSYRLENPRIKYIGNDGIGRTPRDDVATMPYQADAIQVIEIINPEISHTRTGDGISQHFNETIRNATVTKLVNPWIHDCWKCGLVSLDDLMMVEGGVIERCGTAQLSLFGVPGNTVPAVAIGRTQRAFINGTVIDPQGVGTKGVENLYTDGMALLRCDLSGVWIGTPASGAGNGELVVSAQALSGQVRVSANNILAYRDCTTERTAANVVKVGSGTAGTFLPIAANALT
jgi:hypothetical protein